MRLNEEVRVRKGVPDIFDFLSLIHLVERKNVRLLTKFKNVLQQRLEIIDD